MSILHGKQIAGAGLLAIVIATASIIPPTRIVPPCRIVTVPEKLLALLLNDNHPDHTRLLMRKAKVAIGAGHRKGVAEVAAGRNEA
jgi:hypothetical protein